MQCAQRRRAASALTLVPCACPEDVERPRRQLLARTIDTPQRKPALALARQLRVAQQIPGKSSDE